VIGAVFMVVVKELLVLRLGEFHLIVFGVLFILVVLFLPGGLVEAWEKIQRALTRRARRKQVAMPIQETES
jgi:ABC-type branched-subunit amino acid transport system permease subunit